MLRSYARIQSVKEDPLRNLAPESPGFRILSQPPQRADISFEPHPAANPESRRQQLKRFQLNPEPNWGPKMRAKTSTVAAPMLSKQHLLTTVHVHVICCVFILSSASFATQMRRYSFSEPCLICLFFSFCPFLKITVKGGDMDERAMGVLLAARRRREEVGRRRQVPGWPHSSTRRTMWRRSTEASPPTWSTSRLEAS